MLSKIRKEITFGLENYGIFLENSETIFRLTPLASDFRATFCNFNVKIEHYSKLFAYLCPQNNEQHYGQKKK